MANGAMETVCITQPAKDLISAMLAPQRDKRISTAEILDHAWLTHVEDNKSNGEEQDADLGETQQRIKTLSSRKKFKAAALAAVMSAKMRLTRTVKDKALESIVDGAQKKT